MCGGSLVTALFRPQKEAKEKRPPVQATTAMPVFATVNKSLGLKLGRDVGVDCVGPTEVGELYFDLPRVTFGKNFSSGL